MQAEANGQLDCLPVEYRECSWQTKRDRVDICVRLVTEAVWRRREQLGTGSEFDVYFEADDQFVALVLPTGVFLVRRVVAVVVHVGDAHDPLTF